MKGSASVNSDPAHLSSVQLQPRAAQRACAQLASVPRPRFRAAVQGPTAAAAAHRLLLAAWRTRGGVPALPLRCTAGARGGARAMGGRRLRTSAPPEVEALKGVLVSRLQVRAAYRSTACRAESVSGAKQAPHTGEPSERAPVSPHKPLCAPPRARCLGGTRWGSLRRRQGWARLRAPPGASCRPGFRRAPSARLAGLATSSWWHCRCRQHQAASPLLPLAWRLCCYEEAHARRRAAKGAPRGGGGACRHAGRFRNLPYTRARSLALCRSLTPLAALALP